MATKERYIIESMFNIADKEGNDVPFVLNNAQARLDQRLTGRDIIPKARQEGISSYFLARYAVKCMSQRNTRAVVISHERKATERMLLKVQYYLKNIRGPKPVLKNESKNEITFPKTNSMFYIGTAGSREFGRGDTITALHCSEVAFWPDAKKLMAGLFQAVPKTGEIALESTGNGIGNFYHKRVMRAANGGGRYRLHFFNWIDFPEYTFELTSDEEEEILGSLDEDYEEPYLVRDVGLTAGQIAWRREKLDEMDYDMRTFKQEYPLTIDECFQASGNSLFHKVQFQETDDWRKIGPGFWLLDGHPCRSHEYGLGVDVGAGVGKDNSVVEIFSLTSGEQVGEFVTNTLGPDVFGDRVASIGKRFNNAYITVENNNHGIIVTDRLRNTYQKTLLYRDKFTENDKLMDFGHRTTRRSKPLMVGNLKTALAKTLVIHSPFLVSELSSFIEHENGSLGAEEGCHDDRVIACACFEQGRKRAQIIKAKPSVEIIQGASPFTLTSIIAEMVGKRGGGFPIRPQHEVIIH